MKTVVGIRFKPNGKIYYFDPANLHLEENDQVIVDTARGMELGFVAETAKEIPESDLVNPLKEVIRHANEVDLLHYEVNQVDAQEAMTICAKKADDLDLKMHFIDAEFTLDRKKLVLYFTADGRVDFRQLVREMAAVYRTRIELRQVGVRDEAKVLGGLASCGRPLCCANHLTEFLPVHIRMAKEQNLSLNPNKISGLCGRLMCCLSYEHENYLDMMDVLPDVGEIVMTPKGEGTVTNQQIIKECVTVCLKDEKNDDIFLEEFHIDEIQKTGRRERSRKE